MFHRAEKKTNINEMYYNIILYAVSESYANQQLLQFCL